MFHGSKIRIRKPEVILLDWEKQQRETFNLGLVCFESIVSSEVRRFNVNVGLKSVTAIVSIFFKHLAGATFGSEHTRNNLNE